MKILVNMLIDVDPADFEMSYGVSDPKEIRVMARFDAEEAVRHQFLAQGLTSATVTVR